MEKAQEIINQFASFKAPQWIDWIETNFAHEKPQPDVELDEFELSTQLIWIKDNLEKYATDDDVFELTKGVIAVINKYSKNNNHVEGLYHLLLFVGYLKPETFVPDLEKLFTSKSLVGRKYDNIELQHILLNALINCVNLIDIDLTKYFNSALSLNSNHIIYLLGLKYYYSKKSLREYFEYANDVIRRISNYENYEKISKGIVNSFAEAMYYKSNFKTLFKWWTNNNHLIEEESPETYKALSISFLEWLNDKNKILFDDHYAIYLKLYIEGKLEPKENKVWYYLRDILEKDLSSQERIDIQKVIGIYIKNPDINLYAGGFISIATHINSNISLIGFALNNTLIVQNPPVQEDINLEDDKNIDVSVYPIIAKFFSYIQSSAKDYDENMSSAKIDRYVESITA